MNRWDTLGLMGESQGGGPVLPEISKCEVLILGDHFISSPSNNFNDLTNRDFDNMPPCSAVGYAGCGANWLNSQVPSEHSAGIPRFPEVPLTNEEKNAARALGLSEAAINQLGVIENFAGAIDNAATGAMQTAVGFCENSGNGGCCKSVKVRIQCSSGSEWRGRLAQNIFDKDQDLIDWDSEIASARAQSKCDKTATYNCDTQQWGEWE